MVQAADVHRIMKQRLDPWFKEHDYQCVRGAKSFWQRPCGGLHILIWVQLDKYHYDSDLGCKLWLNCCSGAAVTKVLQSGENVLPSEICPESQLRRWLDAKRTVLDKILAQPDLGVFGELFRRDMHRDREEPYRKTWVAEMPYFEIEDVEQWADLILESLPVIDQEMASRLRKRRKQ
jgi:hypothetical protein